MLTKKDIEKLNRITGRIEALQHNPAYDSIKHELAEAKAKMMAVLRAADHALEMEGEQE